MTGFDLNQNPDTTQQFAHTYPTMNASSISSVTDNGTTFIKSNFNGGGSTPNIVYTKSNTTVNFKASQLFIYGNVHGRNGISYTGELIIKNDPLTNAASTPSIYLCFILSYNSNNPPTDIDKIIKNKETTPISIEINSSPDPATGPTYILYNAKNDSGIPCLVAIFTNPIQINTNLVGYSNKCDSLFITPGTGLIYSIVQSQTQGDWMECDYVPIDSEEVATYSLPIQSSLIKDSNSMDSLRTTIMFVTFFIICVFAYFLIPTIYLALLSKLIKNDANANDPDVQKKKKKVVLYMDYVLSFVLGGVGLILISVGAFSDPTKVENTGDILLAGFAVSIIYIISYIIIQARKLGGVFIPGVNYGKAAPAQEEGDQLAQ